MVLRSGDHRLDVDAVEVDLDGCVYALAGGRRTLRFRFDGALWRRLEESREAFTPPPYVDDGGGLVAVSMAGVVVALSGRGFGLSSAYGLGFNVHEAGGAYVAHAKDRWRPAAGALVKAAGADVVRLAPLSASKPYPRGRLAALAERSLRP